MDPEIRSYLSKVKVFADPDYEKTFPELKRAGVEIICKDDKNYELEVDYPLGDFRDPMDDDTLYKKFDSMVLPVTGKNRRDMILDSIVHLEKSKDDKSLTRLLA